MELLQILDQIDEGLSALSSWLEPFWPYLLLLPLFRWALVAVPGRLRSLWGQTLEHPLGDLWPIPAAILPAFIPFARDWDKLAQTGTKRYSVGWLLLAIAVIQIYGQQRSQRYRKAADDAIDRIGAGVESIGARDEQQSALIAALFHEIRKDGTREEEEERAFDNYRDDSEVTTSESKLAQPERSVVAGSSQFGSELAVSPKRDERTIAILKNDQRPNYDQDDEHFLEYFRDDYSEWLNKFTSELPDFNLYWIGELATRWPLFTGLIGVGYIFGVDWTRSQESLSIPEENVCSLIDSWMQRLNEDLYSMRDDNIYPCLVHAINSSIRYGLQKSINDLIDGPQSLAD
jgi:hypothetical protein